MKSTCAVKAVTAILASMLLPALAHAKESGCANHQVKKKPITVPVSQTVSNPDFSVGPSSAEATDAEPSMRENVMHSILELKTAHFNFDNASLELDARTILAKNAEWLKAHPGVRVQVSGNCDQRGTTEYNLALGQHRAAAAREYYIFMGVAESRVAMISYGKENLLCEEATEECWRQNRRVETLVASPAAENLR